MNIFQMLSEAKTEIGFFSIICKLTEGVLSGVRGRIVTISDKQHGNGLQVLLKQSLVENLPDGRKLGYSKMTHTFSIYGDHTLIWQITDGPSLEGLANIQAGLQHLSSVPDSTLLTQETLPPPLHIPFYRSLGYESEEAFEAARREKKRKKAAAAKDPKSD